MCCLLQSSGMRIGFVTGPKPLISRILFHMQASVIHASSLSMVMVDHLLFKWGFSGFMDHVNGVKEFYQTKCQLMRAAAIKHLTGLCEWNVPDCGMFFWIKVRVDRWFQSKDLNVACLFVLQT
jgi:kynurenine/2-aminoadipate aminotransferase